MARATYIWTAHDDDGELVGTWTVKHELVSWLRRGDLPGVIAGIRRYADGQPGAGYVDLGTDDEFLERERGGRDAH